MPLTTRTLAGIRRAGKHRGRGQVDALNWRDVERVCLQAELAPGLAGIRDSCIIRVMSDALLRVSEVVSLDVADVKASTLHLKHSKTDTEGEGVQLYLCDATRALLVKYRERAGVQEGALFRRIRSGDKVTEERLTAGSVSRIIKERCASAGIKGRLSGHSPRVGSAVSLAKAGATLVDMQIAGRWTSPQMPAHYAAAELAERGAIARYKDGKKR